MLHPDLDCIGTPVEVGDIITYGSNGGQHIGRVTKLCWYSDLYSYALTEPDHIESITIEHLEGQHWKQKYFTISPVDSYRLFVVSKGRKSKTSLIDSLFSE